MMNVIQHYVNSFMPSGMSGQIEISHTATKKSAGEQQSATSSSGRVRVFDRL